MSGRMTDGVGLCVCVGQICTPGRARISCVAAAVMSKKWRGIFAHVTGGRRCWRFRAEVM